MIMGADGTIIVAHAAEYRIEFWTVDGEFNRTLVRDTSADVFGGSADEFFHLVAVRLDDAILHLLPGGMGASYRESDIGLPYIDVWEFVSGYAQ